MLASLDALAARVCKLQLEQPTKIESSWASKASFGPCCSGRWTQLTRWLNSRQTSCRPRQFQFYDSALIEARISNRALIRRKYQPAPLSHAPSGTRASGTRHLFAAHWRLLAAMCSARLARASALPIHLARAFHSVPNCRLDSTRLGCCSRPLASELVPASEPDLRAASVVCLSGGH